MTFYLQLERGKKGQYFRPPSDGGLMIPPRTLGHFSWSDLVIFFTFFTFRGVIGRALASHAIDPGSNPGHAMYIIFFQV